MTGNTLPSDEMMAVADGLADSLCTPGGLSAFRKMVQLQRDLAPTTDVGRAGSPVKRATAVTSVGIWERKSEAADAPFVRCSCCDRWSLWADVAEIPAKSHRKRVVLIGESVARGFFYDPHINPAAVLERIVRHAGRSDVEVIDLARIDLGLFSLLQLTESCFVLKPDAIVILAGNNWNPAGALDNDALSRVAAKLRQGESWQSVKQLLEERLARQVRRLVTTLGAWTQEYGIPIVFLVPEFNLADWLAELVAPVILSEEVLSQWLATRARGEYGIERGLYAEACAAADELIRLDQGTSPAGHSIRLRSSLARGMTRGLRATAESVRDSGIALTSHQTPRCCRVAQNILLNEGPRHGLTVVDLPARFEEHVNGELPGRTLFHDYCHLTVEGMRLAMASAAAPVLGILSGTEPAWKSLAEAEIPVPLNVRAEAAVLAAIHNATFGNTVDLVRFHLRTAIALHPPIVETIRRYLDLHIQGTPGPVCSSFAELAQIGSTSIRAFLLRSSFSDKVVHCRLVNRFASVLDEFGAGGSDYADRIMISAHKVEATPVDISRTLRHWNAPDPVWNQAAYAYHRSPTRESRFVIVCENPVEVEVRMTIRTNQRGEGESIVIRVNGAPIHTCVATSRWSDTVFTVPHRVLARGMNELEVIWPELGWASPERVSRICEALESGYAPECRPVFGEIHALTALSIQTATPLAVEARAYQAADAGA